MNLPEGFEELKDFMLKNQSSNGLKAQDIQNGLAKLYGFTSGKITGIIYRACEQGVIVKTSRGVYKLPEVGENKIQNAETIQEKINKAIDGCIEQITSIFNGKIEELSVEDFKLIKEKIESLRNIKEC